MKKLFLLAVIAFFSTSFYVAPSPADQPRRLEILLLGHKSKHHDSEVLANILTKEYFKDGINISYTNNPDDLDEKVLSNYDGLMLYANYDSITPKQEKALLNYVKSGKGFIPIHSASYCFRNSPEVVEMIGGQFWKHTYDTFSCVIKEPSHPVVKNVASFNTRDETYVHRNLSKNIEVITERVDSTHREPYTWVRPYGKGRVFYTAYGHDEVTFNNKGFLQLVKNGILWAVGDEAQSRLTAMQIANPSYSDATIPNYERRNPAPKLQEALSPQQSMSLMQVPVGFELQLFASEPQVINPIFMNWDERGRLWVIETVDYPNEVKTDDIADDRIKILEDTDGDGKADKSTIFADKLNIPTSFTFTNGGIVVSEAPSFLFLKDTNGDDKADVRQTILTGWGKSDTHAQASNLRYGLDNKIWGVVGYSGFQGLVGKDSLKFGNGLYRFTPDGKKMEYLSTTSNNTWGLGFSEEFDVFISTANNTHSGFYGIQKKYLDMAKQTESGVEKIDAHYGMHVATKNLRQVDVPGGFTAAAGHALYTARNYPKEYWNRVAFVNEPTGRLVHKQVLKQSGSGFKEEGDGWNMLVSADEWAAPVQAEIGPDGSLWVVDWYDFIIQHNPTPTPERGGYQAKTGKGNAYENPLRDHQRGRIYRLAYKGNDQRNKLTLSKDDPDGLVKNLSNNNMFWRTTAQRLLVERNDKAVLPALYKLVQNEGADEAGINPSAIHALWTMQGLHALDGANKQAMDVATKALTHPLGGVRRAAIQAMPHTQATIQAMIKAGNFKDPDMRVRLAAVLAATDVKPSAEVGNVLVDMAENEENITDAWLKSALTIAGKINSETFAAAFKKRGLPDNPSLSQASLAQRLAMGSRLQLVPLRRIFGPQQGEAPAPELAGSELLISGDIEKARETVYSGMVVAQGDKANGYALYMMDDKMNFLVNQNGKAYTVSTPQALPAKFSFKAGLQKNGTLSLLIDNKEVGNAKAEGPFKKDPDGAVRVGFDNKTGDNKIGSYPDTFRMRSNLANAKLEYLAPVTPMTAKGLGAVEKTIVLKVVRDVMKYDKTLVTAKAGSVVKIVFQNPDQMQHNVVVIKPSTIEKVGAAADKLASDPNGTKMNYVPKMPEVLQATPLINPGGSFTLTFKLPDVPGDYPYVCTFPGHWRIMRGILRVTK